MPNSRPTYKSFILRLWQEDAEPNWRVRLEGISDRTNPRHFPDLQSFFRFLESLSKDPPLEAADEPE